VKKTVRYGKHILRFAKTYFSRLSAAGDEVPFRSHQPSQTLACPRASSCCRAHPSLPKPIWKVQDSFNYGHVAGVKVSKTKSYLTISFTNKFVKPWLVYSHMYDAIVREMVKRAEEAYT
jgi:hypothetical protein